MNSKFSLCILLCISVALFNSCGNRKADQLLKSKDIKRPNIVYILTDQWRGSALGYAGDPNVKTPYLDQLAKEAVNFKNAVSVTPVCTPHRAALITGRYPTTTGMFVNDIYLPSEEVCMAELFKAEGYNTAYIGKWHLDGHGRENNVAPERRQGFDYWKALECSHNYNKMPYYENNDPTKKYWNGYSPELEANDAINYMREHAKDANPFLLLLAIGAPHYPHGTAPKQYNDMYKKEDLLLAPNVAKPLEESTRSELQGYYGHCTATDAAIGNVVARIKELGLSENTIIVFTSDHGEMMGAHGVKPFTKQLAWDESVRVPFLITYPGINNKKGSTVNAPINTPDILPTLLGLCNITIPQNIEGEDLSTLVKSPDPDYDRAALVMNICPFTGNYKDPEYRAIRTKQYTYIRTLNNNDALFDDINDPYQMNNLYGKSEFKALQQDLEARLNKELKKIGDDFKPRDYYLKKWNLKLDKVKNAIDYWSFDSGNGVMQTPKKQTNYQQEIKH